jgi:organic hydroperoxide reductase OsmC/OhrA
MPEHDFECALEWTGAREGGTTSYGAYSREHRIDFAGKPSLTLSAAPPFRGDGGLHNPEDLLVAALSGCHLLSYLAIAARAGIEVVSYTDEARGRMALVAGGLQFVEVVLSPVVTVARGTDVEKAARLHARAHDECFIARSVAFPVRHTPQIRIAE